jgi:N-formylglutamate amidohydrolase
MDGMADPCRGETLIDPSAGQEHEAPCPAPPVYKVVEPLRRSTPLVFASPHSGQQYPQAFLLQSRLPLLSLRRSEDAFVDELFAAAAGYGAPLLAANLARAYVDVNRDPAELDPDMFSDRLPMRIQRGSPRVQAGLGAIPRIAGDGQDIYRRKLLAAEAKARLSLVHAPYHAMLAALIAEARAAFGCAVLIDCHSMPNCARGPLQPDIVLGDRFGASCHPSVTGFVEAALQRMGYRVARNTPFAGGHTTQLHGRPSVGVHALQVEVNRSLYMDERALTRSAGFERVRRDMTRLAAALTAAQFEKTLR